MEFDFGDGLCLGVAMMFAFVLLWRAEWERADRELRKRSKPEEPPK